MKKNETMKSKNAKWLAALCVCLLCFSVCVGLLVRPTLAADEITALTDLTRTEAVQWGAGTAGSETDSLGATHAKSLAVGGAFTAAGTIGSARYQLDQKYTAITGKLACAEASTADASMELKFYADGSTTPIFTSALITRNTAPVVFNVNVSNVTTLKMELSNSAAPAAAIAQSSGIMLLIEPQLLGKESASTTPAATTTTSPDGSTTSATTTTPDASNSSTSAVSTTAIPYIYKAVSGWSGLYEKLSSSGVSLNPRVFVFMPLGESKPSVQMPVFVKDSKYYVMPLKNDIYVALKQSAAAFPFDWDDAIWAGADKIFNTADDKVASLKDGSYFYEEKAGVWKFLVSRFDYLDSLWNEYFIAVTTTTSTAAQTSSTDYSTSNPILTTGNTIVYPKTGTPLRYGLVIFVVILFAGCAFCGFKLLRKENA